MAIRDRHIEANLLPADKGAPQIVQEAENPDREVIVVRDALDVKDARPGMSRFAWLWDDEAPRREPWDVDLTPNAPFATVPSRGSIVSGWLLVVPRRPVLSVAQLGTRERLSLLMQSHRLCSRPLSNDTTVHVFEHGAWEAGTLHGCGVDQAHLHIVPLPFQLEADLVTTTLFADADPLDPWRNLRGKNYLLLAAKGAWKVAFPPKLVSQFFRRAIANKLGQPSAWDHNAFYFPENVQRTIDDFRQS